ncbi:MAG: alpha/beta fold hydrolase [Methylococcales bacterium]|jgi:triacylglycerol lipase|nr:alpha/beta fold hydrolase [Methylococcales bacterium]MBT7445834.1 alpha/beta fold hydrolase [Methylococcales bacterium]
MIRTTTTLILLLLALPVKADLLVLIHGYLGEAKSWQESGITRVLERYGWHHTSHGNKHYRIINLPSEAPIAIQAQYLTKALTQTRQHSPKEKIILIGHSAGGVVARMSMVQNPTLNIFALMTIASPHLGSDLADKALFLSRTPITMMTPFVGAGTLNRSKQLYADLSTAKPGNLLFWLNVQKHPTSHYVSLLRSDKKGNTEDSIVPLYSQDMRNIKQLQKRAISFRLDNSHTLTKSDGNAIIGILRRLNHQ